MMWPFTHIENLHASLQLLVHRETHCINYTVHLQRKEKIKYFYVQFFIVKVIWSEKPKFAHCTITYQLFFFHVAALSSSEMLFSYA